MHRYHILITCFDVSADHHAARLVNYLQRIWGDRVVWSIMGGEEILALAEQYDHVHLLEQSATNSAIGLSESVLEALRTPLLSTRVRQFLKKGYHKNARTDWGPVDLFLPFDGQGRNLLLGKFAYKLGIRTGYFFPPIVFIWGKWNINKMRIFDPVLCVFEPNWKVYHHHKLRAATYVGHPFAYYLLANPIDSAAQTSHSSTHPSSPDAPLMDSHQEHYQTHEQDRPPPANHHAHPHAEHHPSSNQPIHTDNTDNNGKDSNRSFSGKRGLKSDYSHSDNDLSHPDLDSTTPSNNMPMRLSEAEKTQKSFERTLEQYSLVERTARFREKMNVRDNEWVISIFPGSRHQEIRLLTPLFFRVLKILHTKYANGIECTTTSGHTKRFHLRFMLALSHKQFFTRLSKLRDETGIDESTLPIIHNAYEEILNLSRLALTCSGTVTFKASFLGIPHIIAYRISWLSYWVAKIVVHTPYIGMLNILHDRLIVKELVNRNLSVKNLIEAITPYLNGETYFQERRDELLTATRQICPASTYSHPFKNIQDELARLIFSDKKPS